jgi:hypothetical protein
VHKPPYGKHCMCLWPAADLKSHPQTALILAWRIISPFVMPVPPG